MEVVSNSSFSAIPEDDSEQLQSGTAMGFTGLNLTAKLMEF